MDLKSSSKNNIEAIRKEYHRIDAKWLHMQYHLMLCLVIFTTVVEAGMFFVLRHLNLIATSEKLYLLKYLLTPFVCNAVMALLACFAMQSRCLSDKRKIYLLSFLFCTMAFVIYSIHSIFPALFAIFSIPMIFTIVYGDQRLTAIVALLCLAEKAVSDLFVFWDPERASVLATSASAANFGISLGILAIVYGICGFMILVEREKSEVAINLEQERQHYQTESMTDQLTGVWNRQALRLMFSKMELERQSQRFFLAMIDLDDFKTLNDTYGHSQGDRYLRAMGQVLLDLSNDQVIPFRFGGDEFCLVFSNCDQNRVCGACRTIQECFSRTAVNQTCKAVSVSIGVAEFRKKEPPIQLLDRADAALYRAKQEKGRICFEDLL